MSLKNVIYKNIAAEMARKSMTMSEIANTLNLSLVTISKKLSGKVSITIAEAFELRDKLFPILTIDYLFDTKPRYDNIDLFNFPISQAKRKI